MISKMRKQKNEQLSSNNEYNKNSIINKRNSFNVAMSHTETCNQPRAALEHGKKKIATCSVVSTCIHTFYNCVSQGTGCQARMQPIIEAPNTDLAPLDEKPEMVINDNVIERENENTIIGFGTTV